MMKPVLFMTFDEAAAFLWGYNVMRSYAMQLVREHGANEGLYDAIAKLPVPTHAPAGDPPQEPQEPWVTFREYCS
jgi:hypothetical protein